MSETTAEENSTPPDETPPEDQASTAEADLGTYFGAVIATQSVDTGGIPIVESFVEVVIDEITAAFTVEFTMRYAYRSVNEEAACTTTLRFVYVGSGLADATITVPLRPVSYEIVNLEGSGCGVGDYWDTTAEDDLKAEFEEHEGFDLEVTVANGRIEGYFANGGFHLRAERRN